ncbi:MAG: hypothetical protein WCI67_23685 [Chloroflexales bacterium]
MPTRPNMRLSPEVIAADRATLAAVMNLSDYAPLNAAYATAALQELEATMLANMQAESRILQEADSIRDQVVTNIQAFHKLIKGVRAQVVAQYGDDSVTLHAVGLKRTSERKRPSRRAQPTA